ncbi:MAG: hypothetical protein ACTHKQ_00715, partial [Mesorhizobium sp.]
MITVDLRSLVVPQGTRVWRLFPGSDYKFLKFFIDNASAFLDLPAFEFPSAGKLSPNAELLARMLASEDTRKKVADSGVHTPATVDWKPFQGARRTSTRMSRVAAIINFYQEAKQGDYVIVPATLSERRVFVGRLASPNVHYVKYRYGDHQIPA